MVNVLNPTFTSYVNHLATGLAGGSLAIGSTTIKVSLDGLGDNIEQLSSARKALSLWAQATGLNFVGATVADADIVFTNDSSRSAYTEWSGGYAHIDVAKNWMQGWPLAEQWRIGSYGLQTFIHEIGHALGLDHGGDYNGSADYSTDRLFDIDTWQYSVMSYFDQTNYAANNASYLFLSSPMLADIEAIRVMYGDLAVNASDTTYGRGSSTMLGVTDFGVYADAAFSIRDSGGYDTLDFSNARRGGMIDMTPGSYSNVNGYIGNVGIALGTIIERTYGSEYNDTVIGNVADNRIYGNSGKDRLNGADGNDYLNGGHGNDVMTGGNGNDIFVFNKKLNKSSNVDGITDFTVGEDQIYLENAVFKKLKTTGELSEAAFVKNESGRAQDKSDRIIYDTNDGYLYYDADGKGSSKAVKFALLDKHLDLTYHDFLVV
jgi:serralysin